MPCQKKKKTPTEYLKLNVWVLNTSQIRSCESICNSSFLQSCRLGDKQNNCLFHRYCPHVDPHTFSQKRHKLAIGYWGRACLKRVCNCLLSYNLQTWLGTNKLCYRFYKHVQAKKCPGPRSTPASKCQF